MPGCFRFGRALLGLIVCASFAASAGAADPDSSSAPNPLPARNAASSDRVAQRARQLFDEGVQLANEGRFESARAVFRSAYELQPHPSVLYNIAQCEVRLGDKAGAVATLQRFLETGGREIGERQRQAVQRQLDELRAGLPAEPPASGAPPAPALAELAPSGTGPADAAAKSLPLERAAPVPDSTATGSDKPHSLRPLVLVGTGVALLGAATALYFWNDARHDDWSTEHAELAAIPSLREQLADDLELWQRASSANHRLSSIHTVDAVTVLLASAGALAVGAGVWDWLRSDGSERQASLPLRVQVSSAPMLQWHGRW